jgi:RNA polymerase sigma-B factor
MISGRDAERDLSRPASRAEAAAADANAARIIAALTALSRCDPRREQIRRQAICAWAPLARRLARRYATGPSTIEDLEQTAMIALIAAVDRFDPDLGVAFVAYAIPTIAGELKRYFRDRGSMIRLPSRLHDRYRQVMDADTRLCQTLSRRPTVVDIANELQLNEEEVAEAVAGGHAYRPSSLATPISADGRELGDTLGAPDYGYEFTEWHLDLCAAVTHLTDREKDLLSLRYYGNLTQTEIAAEMGLSQMQISRLLAATLDKLRTHLLSPISTAP